MAELREKGSHASGRVARSSPYGERSSVNAPNGEQEHENESEHEGTVARAGADTPCAGPPRFANTGNQMPE